MIADIDTAAGEAVAAGIGGLFVRTDVGQLADNQAAVAAAGASDLVRGALADYAPNPTALAVFALWVVAMGALAVWGYRRDEGRRFS